MGIDDLIREFKRDHPKAWSDANEWIKSLSLNEKASIFIPITAKQDIRTEYRFEDNK